jgi:hypothetical protein
LQIHDFTEKVEHKLQKVIVSGEMVAAELLVEATTRFKCYANYTQIITIQFTDDYMVQEIRGYYDADTVLQKLLCHVNKKDEL